MNKLKFFAIIFFADMSRNNDYVKIQNDRLQLSFDPC
jgi:hypothetical protein